MTEMQQFRYFSAVQDRLFRRCGTAAFIGATRTPAGFVWNTDKIVAIPHSEVTPNLKTYNNAVRRGDLVERKREDYAAQTKAFDVSTPASTPEPDPTPEESSTESTTDAPTDAAPIPKRKRRNKSRG